MTALIDVTDYLLTNMDNRKLTGIAYLDLRKAFDTVDPDVLLQKLTWIGILDQEHKWFTNYLTNRKQKVSLAGSTSEPLTISYGVPQGSILGPLLFIFFINDLPKVINHCQIGLYADDTVLMYSGTTSASIERSLQEDLNNTNKWLKKNRLHLNVKKTTWSLIGTHQKLASAGDMSLQINGELLHKVSAYKYLGLWIDEKMNWNKHLDYMCAKISKRLGILKRTKLYLPAETLKMLYNALVLPLFDYGDIVYSNCGATQMQRLQRLQNKGARLILGCPPRTHSSDMRYELKWLTVQQRATLHLSCMVHKCMYDSVPTYLQNIFNHVHSVHNYSTRASSNNNLILPKPNTNQLKRTFIYRGTNTWNNLDMDIRNIQTVCQFRKAVTKCLVTSV